MRQPVPAYSTSDEQAHRTLLCRLVCHHSAFLLLHNIALGVFAFGFLLTRVELHSVSTCADLRDSGAAWASSAGRGANASAGCWAPQHFDKAVLVVIDALRFDVAVPTNGSPGDIPILQELAREAVCAFPGCGRRLSLLCCLASPGRAVRRAKAQCLPGSWLILRPSPCSA